MPFRPAIRFVLIGAAVASTLLHQTAVAQIGGPLRGAVASTGSQAPAQVQGELNLQRPPAYEWMRMSGTWVSPYGTLVLNHAHLGRMTGQLAPVGGGPAQAIVLFVDVDAAIAEGVWGSQGTNVPGGARFTVRLTGDGNGLEFRYPGTPPGNHPQVWSATREFPAATPSPRWLGTWDTTLGRMTVRAEGNHLLGTIAGGNSATGRISARVVAFADLTAKPGKSAGAWRDTSTLESGLLSWQMSADGSKFFGTYTRPVRDTDTEEAWSGTRVGGGSGQAPATPVSTTVPASLAARYAGEWRVPLALFAQPAPLVIDPTGTRFTLPGSFGNHEVALKPSADLMSLEGSITNLHPVAGTRSLRLVVSPDNKKITAYRIDENGLAHEVMFAGSRAGAADATPSPPASTSPVPATPPLDQAPPAAFKPLNRVNVRMDRVVVARGYPTYQVHAFVTVRNASPSPQYFTSGFLRAVLADADGMALERNQPYRASGEPAQLFSSTPVIQPGGELKVRYVFTPADDARPTSLTLSEGDKRAEFAVGAL